MATAIDAGVLNACGASFADTQDNSPASCFGNDYDQSLSAAHREGRPTDDIFYRFSLTANALVTLSHCATGLAYEGRDPDTYIHLLDASGNQIMSNDDDGPSCNNGRGSVRRYLVAGTYYVVSELYNPNSACNLTTTISTSAAPALSLTAQSTTLTAGSSTILTANGAEAYTWSPAIGLSATTGNSITATPARTTTYTVSATGQSLCVSAPVSVTIVVNTVALPPSDPAADLNRNWAQEISYDGNSTVISESKQFADALGRPIQAQVKNIAARQVLASQVIYNSGGQAALNTLPAPTNNQEFKFKEKFITAVGQPNQLYSAANFEGTNANNPSQVDASSPLGSYYSTQNALEPATPATYYPFSLAESYEGPIGGMKRAAGPGDAFRMGLGRESKSRELPILNELTHYLSLRPNFVPTGSGLSLAGQGLKSISIDADGKESIAFTDKEGLTLATCLSGAQYAGIQVQTAINSNPSNSADQPLYQDLHIPAAGPITVTLQGSGSVRIINLQTGEEITSASPATLLREPGFYRFLSLIDNQVVSYPARYGDFSYTYYDDARRPVASIAPKGVLLASNLVLNPGFEQDNADVQTVANWQTSGSADADFTQTYGGGYTGAYHGTHYAPSSGFSVYTYQVISNLPTGYYTLRAWVKGGANQQQMEARINGTVQAVNIPYTPGGGLGAWSMVEIPNLSVASGQCEIGFRSSGTAGQFIYYDQVEFTRQNAPLEFVTRNTYSGTGTLLATENTDEGRTDYVYAKDGRIRFSQSAQQRLDGRFSYSNYDQAGRVVESGEYTMATDRTQGKVFESEPSQVVTYEAENGTANPGFGNSWPGYSGMGFADNLTSPGTYAAVSVTVPAAGIYALEYRYAAAIANSTRTLSVYVNNVDVVQAAFPSTNGWSNWTTQTVYVALQAGSNTVRFQYDDGDTGWINLDYVRLKAPLSNSVLTLLEERVPFNGLDLGRCAQRNQVWYDQPFTDSQLGGRTQEFVLGAVSKTSNGTSTTWYSYDDQGRVTRLVQETPTLGVKTVEYTYDFTGNVREVAYQKGQPDAFYHHYQYDANQRLQAVATSPNGTTQTVQARYFYYLHGPLKRV
ncbi:MAG: carbohydrate-binding protein, partial [Hymenobacter sp.]|nr:carbohydrate-binding protein [Hymenobacter sp.]